MDLKIKFTPAPAAPGFAKLGVVITDAGGAVVPATISLVQLQSAQPQPDGSYIYTLGPITLSAGPATAVVTPLDINDQPVGASQSFMFTVSLQDGNFQPAVVSIGA